MAYLYFLYDHMLYLEATGLKMYTLIFRVKRRRRRAEIENLKIQIDFPSLSEVK